MKSLLPDTRLYKYQPTEILISIAAGGCFAVSVANHFLRFWYRSPGMQIFLILGLTLFFSAIIFGVLYYVAKPVIILWQPQKKLMWSLIPIIVSSTIIFVFPKIIPGLPEWTKTPLPPKWHQLEIQSLLEQNNLSLSNEIWLRELRGPDGSVVPFHKLVQTGEWHITNEPYYAIVSNSGVPSSIRYNFYSHWDKEISITFYAHPAAGKASIHLDNQTSLVDLYNPSEGDRAVTLRTGGELVWQILLYGVDIVTLSLIILFLLFAYPLACIVYRPLEKSAIWINTKLHISLTHVEWFAALVVTVLIWLFLSTHAGGPSAGGIGGRDNLWYLFTAMFSVQEPSLLNRYFHIYLIKLFLSLFGNDPFLTVKVYWGFCIAFTALFVYINCRLIATHLNRLSGVIQGILALMLFLPQPEILSLQMSLTDYPLMLLSVIAVTIYLLHIRWPNRRKFLLVAFGLVAFFAFKTKENGLALLFLTFGFGIEDNDRFNWGRFRNAITWIATGIIIGQIIFVLLDAIILKNIFFEFEPATWQKFVSFNTDVKNFRTYDSWYWPFLFDPRRFTIFILSLASLIYLERRQSVSLRHRVIWALPMALIILLSAFMVKSEWGIITRYVLWSLPIFSILSVQFLQPCDDSADPHPVKFFLVFLGAWLFAAIASDLIIHPTIEAYFKWDRRMFLDAILSPLALTFLIGLLILSKKFTYLTLFISMVCLAIILSPFQSVFSVWQEEPDQLMKMKWARISENAYYPYIKFSDEIQASENTSLYVSPDLEKEQMLSVDPQNNLWSMSIFFKTKVKSVDHFSTQPFKPSLLIDKQFDYAFLKSDNWDDLSANQREKFLTNYETTHDGDRGIIFLKKR